MNVALEGFSPAEIETALLLLRRMRENIEEDWKLIKKKARSGPIWIMRGQRLPEKSSKLALLVIGNRCAPIRSGSFFVWFA